MKRTSNILIIFLVLSLLLPGIRTEAGSGPSVVRLSGSTRVETSISVSQKSYKGNADTVFLAGFNGDADALTASFLAGQRNAPLLLTYKDKLDPKLLKEIARLKAKTIIILGGEKIVHKSVEDTLRSKGYNTKRIKGSTRVETAVNVAVDYYKNSSVDEVFIVEYNSLVDALTIGPVAAKLGIPVLISKKTSVPNELAKFLKNHNVKKATIIGGSNTVNSNGRAQLLKYVNRVDRISGSNRVQTGLNIAEEFFKNPSSTIVANGYEYADALIGGYFAGIKDGPIVLTESSRINSDALTYIKDKDVKSFVLGGTKAVANSIIDEIKDTPAIMPPDPSTGDDISEAEKEVIRLVNIERKRNGLREFTNYPELSQVARLKSKDMFDNNYFDHTSPIYGSPFDMMKRFGIGYNFAGENIAMGYPSPEAVVKGWMNSPGHRANILNKNFNRIGVGVYSSNESIYWTQMFID